jgi:hypothetical protein
MIANSYMKEGDYKEKPCRLPGPRCGHFSTNTSGPGLIIIAASRDLLNARSD